VIGTVCTHNQICGTASIREGESGGMLAGSGGCVSDGERAGMTRIQIHRQGRSVDYAKEAIHPGADTCEGVSPTSSVDDIEGLGLGGIDHRGANIPRGRINNKHGIGRKRHNPHHDIWPHFIHVSG